MRDLPVDHPHHPLQSWLRGSLELQVVGCVSDRGKRVAELMGEDRQELALAAVGLLQRCRLLLQLSLHAAAFGDVSDVALNHGPMVLVVHIADELHLDLPPCLGFER